MVFFDFKRLLILFLSSAICLRSFGVIFTRDLCEQDIPCLSLLSAESHEASEYSFIGTSPIGPDYLSYKLDSSIAVESSQRDDHLKAFLNKWQYKALVACDTHANNVVGYIVFRLYPIDLPCKYEGALAEGICLKISPYYAQQDIEHFLWKQMCNNLVAMNYRGFVFPLLETSQSSCLFKSISSFVIKICKDFTGWSSWYYYPLRSN